MFVLPAACTNEAATDWMAQARAAHAATDANSEDGRRALQAFLLAPVPSSLRPDDARVVRQDAAYRLARLWLADGLQSGSAFEAGAGPTSAAAKAMAVVEKALSEGRGDDVFTANLLVARGQAHEALGEPVEAAADYHDALLINEKLLELALGADDPAAADPHSNEVDE